MVIQYLSNQRHHVAKPRLLQLGDLQLPATGCPAEIDGKLVPLPGELFVAL